MPKDVVIAEPANQLPAPVAGMLELDESAIAEVAGGLNPQPLPPRHGFRFD